MVVVVVGMVVVVDVIVVVVYVVVLVIVVVVLKVVVGVVVVIVGVKVSAKDGSVWLLPLIYHICCYCFCWQLRVLHYGLSKYPTAQDTHFTSSPTKHSRTLSSHGNLLSLQSQSMKQELKGFFCA